MRLIVASNNANKLREFREILGEQFDIVSMREAGIDADIEENGTTFEENALIKANYVMNAGNSAAINQMFARSRNYRDSFSSRSLGSIKKTYRVFCDIIDESGAIATIATTLAVNGISIKNIGIVHNREFEEGVLQIEFYEEEPSLRAADVLRQHRYQVWVR